VKFYFCNNISWQSIGEKLYVIDEVSLKVYTFENVGKLFIERIQENKFCEIVEEISSLYKADYHIVYNDMVDFVNDLIEVKILTRCEV